MSPRTATRESTAWQPAKPALNIINAGANRFMASYPHFGERGGPTPRSKRITSCNSIPGHNPQPFGHEVEQQMQVGCRREAGYRPLNPRQRICGCSFLRLSFPADVYFGQLGPKHSSKSIIFI